LQGSRVRGAFWSQILVLFLVVGALAGCAGARTATAPSPLAQVTERASGTPVFLPTRTDTRGIPTAPGVPSPSIIPTIQLTSVTPTPPVGQTVTPPPTLTPADTLTPQRPGAPAFLVLPLQTRLVASPPGGNDVPLHGVTALAVDSAGGLIAAGTDSLGVLVSRDGGRTWQWSNENLPAGAGVRWLAAAHGWLMAGIEGAGVFRNVAAGGSWEPMVGLSANTQEVIFSPQFMQNGLLLAIDGGALLRSVDHGDSWAVVLSAISCPLSVSFAADGVGGGSVYATRCDRLVRSADQGINWSPVPPAGARPDLGYLQNLRANPFDPTGQRLHASGSSQGLPLRSDDGGQSWEPAYDPQQAPFVMGTLWGGVRVDADGAWYVTGRGHMYDPNTWLWRSVDQGGTWYPAAGARGLVDLVVLPDGSLWAGTTDGVFADQGTGWHLVHPGGNQPAMVDIGAPGSVVLTWKGVDKYTSLWRWFEKLEGVWIPVWQGTTNMTPRRGYLAPGLPAERAMYVLGQDYGGQIMVLQLEPDADETISRIESIPAGPSDSLEDYRIEFDADYLTTGRVSIRHGRSGALYLSDDWGASWTRPDPIQAGACERTPVSGFGRLWAENEQVRLQLLCPLEDEQPYAGTAQPFEHGELLRLDPTTPSRSDRWVYALLPTGEVDGAWGSLPWYERPASPTEPPAGFYPPDVLFYAAWWEGYCCASAPQPVSQALGWATGAASAIEVAQQQFEGGTLLWRSDRDQIVFLRHVFASDLYTTFPD